MVFMIQKEVAEKFDYNIKNMNKYDCFIYMFHDQALIPFKYISNFSGVNFTGNLDIIRTSPDHGTAFDLAGQNLADETSIVNAIKMAASLSRKQQNGKTSPA